MPVSVRCSTKAATTRGYLLPRDAATFDAMAAKAAAAGPGPAFIGVKERYR
jgi:hypothetical protein